MTMVWTWRPRGWRTIDTTATARKVTAASQEVVDESARAQAAIKDLRESAEAFARQQDAALRLEGQ